MDKQIVREISEGMVKRYSDRYNKLGYDVKTLGWGSADQQRYRFAQVLNSPVSFEKRSVLDIGCGFGDFGKFLFDQQVPFSRYEGWDINPDLVGEASTRWKANTNFSFKIVNIVEDKPAGTVADIGVMLGVLNLNFHDKLDNFTYTRQLVTNAFALVKEVLIVDFLSARLAKEYPKEDFVFYHDPLEVLKFALTLSDKVVLKHEYAPIPQKEFMVCIYK